MARWLWLVAAVATVCGVTATTVLPAQAEEPVGVGWWWLGRPSATIPVVFSPLPAPPERGLYVSGGPSGASGVSALRYEVSTDAIVSTLTLGVAEAVGTLAIDACPARNAWEPAENGGWDQRAEPDCDAASVRGVVDEERMEVSFALSSLGGDVGVIDLVLVPGKDPDTRTPASFSVTFEPPDTDALAVSEGVGRSEPPASSSVPSGGLPPSSLAPPDTLPPASGFAAPPSPVAETELPALGEPQPLSGGAESIGPVDGGSAPVATTRLAVDEAFAYPAVLALPLVLLCLATFLGWSLTQPVMVTGGHDRRRP